MTEGTEPRPGFLDRPVARLCAVAVIAACLALLGVYHRNDLMPGAKTGNTGLNPEFVDCRDKRSADVDKMLSDGVITATQHSRFLQRALAYCTSQFPPDGK